MKRKRLPLRQAVALHKARKGEYNSIHNTKSESDINSESDIVSESDDSEEEYKPSSCESESDFEEEEEEEEEDGEGENDDEERELNQCVDKKHDYESLTGFENYIIASGLKDFLASTTGGKLV